MSHKFRSCLFLVLLTCLAACRGVGGNTLTPLLQPSPSEATSTSLLVQGTNGFPWWNDTVFYEIFVRSFQDSDGDGIGDLRGLISRLDYLNDGDPNTKTDLGITGIWLMPIMESPSYHGYDVADYYKIDPDYGSNEDFRLLIEEAHRRGIRVIVDLVLNHTSTRHPWFQAATDLESENRDWYIWVEENPLYLGPWRQKVWHRSFGHYYYGLFWGGMPDLNYENPAVTAQMYDVTRFWLEEMGVDGFRLDAIKHLIEDGQIQENTEATHAWLEDFYRYYKTIKPNALTVGEAWTSTAQVLDYTGDEVDIAFQFDLAEKILNASEYGARSLIQKELDGIVESYPSGQYATFITNHDQNRIMSQLNQNVGVAKVAASILLTAPGVPFLYYGEEIGMTGTKPDENIRLPMQWIAPSNSGDDKTDRGVGFTTGRPWRNLARNANERNSVIGHQFIQTCQSSTPSCAGVMSRLF
ncbi:alpha-amylase [Chloroflexi bacterium TSY]|nr:alpha-amylase [Chloroflexi bacterium TSY]